MADKSIQETPSPSPPPCAKGCGFFGSPSTMNMCSKCFRDHRRSNQVAQEPTTPQTPVTAPVESTDPATASFSPAILRPVPVTRAAPQASAAVSLPAAIVIEPSEVQKADVDMKTAFGEDPTAPPPRKVQKNTSRCFSCRKKIGLTGFKCHCGYFYCSEHRYSDKHACDFDYQASAREQLEKANPVVVASKLDRI